MTNFLITIGFLTCIAAAGLAIFGVIYLIYAISQTYDKFKALRSYVYDHAGNGMMHTHKYEFNDLCKRVEKLEQDQLKDNQNADIE